jgi:hypothetical protein
MTAGATAVTANGDEASLSALDCLSVLQQAGFAAETNLDRGVWMFYPYPPAVECFIDISDYNNDESILYFSALFRAASLPTDAPTIVAKLNLAPDFAYAQSPDCLTLHREVLLKTTNLDVAEFGEQFQSWIENLKKFSNHIKELN